MEERTRVAKLKAAGKRIAQRRAWQREQQKKLAAQGKPKQPPSLPPAGQ